MAADEIWLTIAPGTQIAVDRSEAMQMDRNALAKLYLDHLYGSRKKDALAWADQQIELRKATVGA